MSPAFHAVIARRAIARRAIFRFCDIVAQYLAREGVS
jgi:hypothetical protein